jgi:ABC-type polysaccharide/polyol phosphate transport system ATPase subunit
MIHHNLLVSLHSLKNRCGLAILDTLKWRWSYLQVVNTSRQVKLNQIRGINIVNDVLYAVTPASMQIYKIRSENFGAAKPLFELQREIIIPEWLLGEPEQANIIALHASVANKRIYVSNNSLGSIDILDLSGELIDRRHLWQIAPSIFKPPHSINQSFKYPIVRFIFEDSEGKLNLTIMDANSGNNGVVIAFDDGKRILNGLDSPHGGLISGERLYLLEVKNGTLKVFRAPKGQSIIPTAERIITPEFPFSDEENPIQNMRGIALANDRIYCGVFNLKRSTQKRLPARIVCFDSNSGRQLRTVFVPDSIQFPNPRIFSLATVTASLIPEVELHKPILYVQKQITTPEQRSSSLVSCWGGSELRPNQPGIGTLSKGDRSGSTISVVADEKDSGPVCASGNPDDVKAFEKKIAVTFENASLCYRRTARFGIGKNRRLRKARNFWALQDLSFTLYEGETIGIIGRNGSGKSTMAQLCGNVLSPDTGRVDIFGTVQLLSLGLGFKKDMTGRDNVYISGALLGMSRRQISDHMLEIEDFAEIGDFIDEPMSTYSSGMRSRLGFAIATAVEPDILILDEVMATGDKAFRDKAIKRMEMMRQNAKTVVVISHNPGQLKRLCSRALWLEKGRLVFDGPPRRTLSAYQNFCQNPERWLSRNPRVKALLKDAR